MTQVRSKKSHKRHKAVPLDTSDYKEQMRPGNHYVCCGTAKPKHEYPICKKCSPSEKYPALLRAS